MFTHRHVGLKMSLKQEKTHYSQVQAVITKLERRGKSCGQCLRGNSQSGGQVRNWRVLQNTQHDHWSFGLLSQLLFWLQSPNQSEIDLVSENISNKENPSRQRGHDHINPSV